MSYHPSIEQLLARYCDEAQGRESLHRAAYHHYKRKLTCMQLPIIVLSALSGSVQLFAKTYPDHESAIVTGTAFLSIGVSIISACLSYLKLGELKSRHEVSQVAWQNFYNSLVHQLNLSEEFREDPVDFIQEVRTTYNRLFEISPMLNKSFMVDVKKRVRKSASDRFIIPAYMNGFHHSHIWGQEENDFVDNSINDDIRRHSKIPLQIMFSGDSQSVPVHNPEVVPFDRERQRSSENVGMDDD